MPSPKTESHKGALPKHINRKLGGRKNTSRKDCEAKRFLLRFTMLVTRYHNTNINKANPKYLEKKKCAVSTYATVKKEKWLA